jgi:hypothetical protein
MAGTRKGPKVKRLERIAELFAGKPQQALAAAVDSLDKLRGDGEDCALGSNHRRMVEFLHGNGFRLDVALCQKRVPSSRGNCYRCEGTGRVGGLGCPECNGTGTWFRCHECGGSGRRGRSQCQSCVGSGFKARALFEEAARVMFSVAGKQYIWDVSSEPPLSVPVNSRTARLLNRSGSRAELARSERLEARDLADWVMEQFRCGALTLTAEDTRALAASTQASDLSNASEPEPFLIVTKVAGVAHLNRDGSSRQRNVSDCRTGDRVHLQREPDNSFDRNAVVVSRSNGGQLGYLPATVASEIAPQMDRGISFEGRVERISSWEDGTRGLDLAITRANVDFCEGNATVPTRAGCADHKTETHAPRLPEIPTCLVCGKPAALESGNCAACDCREDNKPGKPQGPARATLGCLSSVLVIGAGLLTLLLTILWMA